MVERPKVDMVNEEIVNKNSSVHIQRLPTFMLREIQTWNETIKKADGMVDDNLSEMSKDEIKWIKQADLKRSNNVADVGLIEARTANKQLCFSIRALPLPKAVTKLLESNGDLIKTVSQVSAGVTLRERKELRSMLAKKTQDAIKNFVTELKDAFEQAGEQWNDAINFIWAFGPRGMGPNILLNRIQRYKRCSIWSGMIDDVYGEGISQFVDVFKRHFT